jgi:hypothetical protein
MSLSTGTRAKVVALAIALTLTPLSLASAQRTPTANEVALARQEFDAGNFSVRDAQWEQALQHFTRSYELAPRPVTLLNLAGAQAQTGKLVAASESYRRFMSTASERDAERYRAQAEQALAAIEARFAHVQVEIEGLRDDDEVSLDDAPLSHASLSLTMPLDPGQHTLTVRRSRREVARSTFSAREGETSAVRLEVSAAAAIPTPEDTARGAQGGAATSALGLDGASDTAPADDEGGGGLFASPWFWLVTGVVVAGAATAVIVVATSGGTPDPFQGTLTPGSIVVE